MNIHQLNSRRALRFKKRGKNSSRFLLSLSLSLVIRTDKRFSLPFPYQRRRDSINFQPEEIREHRFPFLENTVEIIGGANFEEQLVALAGRNGQ